MPNDLTGRYTRSINLSKASLDLVDFIFQKNIFSIIGLYQ